MNPVEYELPKMRSQAHTLILWRPSRLEAVLVREGIVREADEGERKKEMNKRKKKGDGVWGVTSKLIQTLLPA